MSAGDDKLAEADALASRAQQLREQARIERMEEGRKRQLAERLRYAAYDRCRCGAGLAYDPFQEDSPTSPFRGPDAWECSALLLATEPIDEERRSLHTPALPFAFYEIKSEDQPSARGATTRPRETSAVEHASGETPPSS